MTGLIEMDHFGTMIGKGGLFDRGVSPHKYHNLLYHSVSGGSNHLAVLNAPPGPGANPRGV
jgi:hypothetical protein